MTNESLLWVGVFKTTGALVVFDPGLQSDSPRASVQLYSVKKNVVRTFDKVEVKAMLETASFEQREKALEAYEIWMATEFANYRAPETVDEPKTTKDPHTPPRWKKRAELPKRNGQSMSSNLAIGTPFAAAVLSVANPLLGIGILVGGLLWAKSLGDKEDEAKKRHIADWRKENRELYDEYLQSDTWSYKRYRVIRRANGICEEEGCTATIVEVHHKLYPKRLGDEPIEWLEGLCEQHHRQRHNK